MRASRLAVYASVLLAGTLAVSAVYAQSQRHLVRGMITSVAQGSFVVTDRDGKAVTVKTTPATRIIGRTAGSLQDVKTGDRVRLLASKAQDGSLTAIRLQDAPSGLELPGGGKGGQRELKSGQVLVSGSVVSLQGTTLSLAAANAAVTAVTVPQGVPVQRMTVLPVSTLAQGTRVMLLGTDNQDGTVTAAFITVGSAQRP